MPNDREFIPQALITEGRVVTLAEIDPTTSYLQIGVWQDGQQKAGSPNNGYPSYAIAVSELGGGGPPVTHLQNYVLVDGRYGNDSTAVRNNDFLPFLTVDAAIAASLPNDTIMINPGFYFTTTNILPKTLTYYCRPGVTWFITTFNNAAADRELRILGYGNITFTGVVDITGDHNKDITIECLRLDLGIYWFLNNGPYLSGATQPLTLTMRGPRGLKTITQVTGPIGILWSLPWQLQVDWDSYRSNIFFAGADFWCIQDFQNAAAPPVKTKTVININRATLVRNGVPFLSMVAGNNANENYINANIYHESNGGGAPFVIRMDGGGDPLACRQLIFFDGVVTIKNGSMLYDQAGSSAGEQGKVQIKGKIYNSDTNATVLETPFYCTGGSLVEIRADVISSSANNNIVIVGGTRSQVDIRNCKLVNTDGTGTAPAVISKSNGINNVLRLVDAKIVTFGANSIIGAAPAEPMQLYSAYSNAPTDANMTNTLTGPVLFVDAAITDNGF